MKSHDESKLPEMIKETALRAKVLKENADKTHMNADRVHKKAHALDERAKKLVEEEVNGPFEVKPTPATKARKS